MTEAVELKKGDRVVVTMRRRKIMYETEDFWRGQIIGETRDGGAWIVRRESVQMPSGLPQEFLLPGAA